MTVVPHKTDGHLTQNGPTEAGMFSIVFYFLIHFILVFLNAFFIIGPQHPASTTLQTPNFV